MSFQRIGVSNKALKRGGPVTDGVHEDLRDILAVLGAGPGIGPDILKAYSYEAKRTSGRGEVTVFDDKYLGTVELNSQALAVLENLIIPKAGVDREVALSSQLQSGHFLPLLDLEVESTQEFTERIDGEGSEPARILLRRMQPMIYESGNSLHLYGTTVETPEYFSKFCGEALLALTRPPCEVLDVRWLGHSLARGEFHFRITHKTGVKVQLPCRNQVAEAKLALSLARWAVHDRRFIEHPSKSKATSLS